MEIGFRAQCPSSPPAFREALYQGELFHLPSTFTTRSLVEVIARALESELGPEPRMAQFRMSGDDFFRAIGRLRRLLFHDPALHQQLRQIIRETGLEPEKQALDPLRIRVIAHGGHQNPKAAPIYNVHRDTWYGHPPGQISWWIPIHDLKEEETFVFFPEYFHRAAANDSRGFDFDEWVEDKRELRVGWQDADAGRTAHYPAFHGDLNGIEQIGFSCRAGDLILFAGAHLHQTLSNESGQTRFSVDFRTVQLEDHAQGRGAPILDTFSTGSALPHYLQPGGA